MVFSLFLSAQARPYCKQDWKIGKTWMSTRSGFAIFDSELDEINQEISNPWSELIVEQTKEQHLSCSGEPTRPGNRTAIRSRGDRPSIGSRMYPFDLSRPRFPRAKGPTSVYSLPGHRPFRSALNL